ncbi:MAG TPA: hypothetical protein VIM37_01180 [Candidatus Microsaccharimonas sp.]|jgi:hypothetical protein
MATSSIAGLDDKNVDDWDKIAAAYGMQQLPTGGLPEIPANAETEGIIDPSTSDVGTVITVITETPTKYVLTVLANGQVSIERFAWHHMYGFKSFGEDLAEYESQKAKYDKHLELAEQGFSVNLPYVPSKPLQLDASQPFNVRPFEAGHQMFVHHPDWDEQNDMEPYVSTSRIVFWTIDHS